MSEKIDATKEKVLDIIAKQYGVAKEKLNLDDTFASLGDSLDAVELVMELEDRFDLKIPDEEAERIATIGEAINVVKEKLGEPPIPYSPPADKPSGGGQLRERILDQF